MSIEVNAQSFIQHLLEQNKRLVAEITALRVALGIDGPATTAPDETIEHTEPLE